MGLVDTTVFPADAISPEALITAAAAIRFVGSRVEVHSHTVVRTWRGLTHVYQAPEAARLVAGLDPIPTSAETFRHDLAATADALELFAAEARTIQKTLETVRTEANTFLSGIHDGSVSRVTWFRGEPYDTDPVPWVDDPVTVLRNNALLAQVNEQQVLLWAAERKCATTISGLVGGPPVTAATAATCGRGHGFEQVPEGYEMPWGAAAPVPEKCHQAVLRGAGTAAMGTVVGIAGLAGVRNPTFDPAYAWYHPVDFSRTTRTGADAAVAWRQLGTWATGMAGEELALSLLPGPVGAYFRQAEQTYDQSKRDWLAADQWGTDPAAAAGTVAFNLGTLVLSASRVGRAGTVVEPSRAAESARAPAARTPTAYGGHGSIAEEMGPDVGPASRRNYRADQAGGPILRLSIDRVQITPRGVEVVEQHLARFDPDPKNDVMVTRLRAVAAGELTVTPTDLRFYTHELRESVRYRKIGYELGVTPAEVDRYDIWNDLHTASLEDYRLHEDDNVLYFDRTQIGER